MALRVGQKVVCVLDGPAAFATGHEWGASEAIFEGNIYTVARYFLDHSGEPLVWLEEVRRSPLSRMIFGDDAGYAARRFRPVVERETDISIFEKMLTGGKQPARVD
jgi:hypothetical protein